MSEELKPCPFCGCRATMLTDAENMRITGSHGAACPFRDVDVIVNNRDAWNTRAAIKAGQGEAVAIAECREVHGHMCQFLNRTQHGMDTLRDGDKLYTAPAGIEALKGAEHCAECSTITARLDGDNCAKWCCHCGARLHGSYVSADELRALLALQEPKP